MNKGLLSLIVGGLLAGSASGAVEGQQAGLLSRQVSLGKESYSYQVFIPSRLAGQKNPPVIIFLHGIGQRGTGGFVPTSGAAGAMARHYLEQVPAVILLPQCQKGSYWTDSKMDQMVMQELDQTIAEFGADRGRVYLTGVSMGGYGAWHLASQHEGRFAAIVSICGGSPLQSGERFAPIARKVGPTPVWVFHGAEDPVVPVEESRQMVAALKANKGSVRYSEYAGVGHNVWLKTLAEKELLPWLLAQRLG
ncbi:MAG TPA: YqiA/YcfP family alpha/beta fold hydrolase [Pyrinomonadaceae bacterium]|jgi:predicted peptidase